jgi:hypothetical protein
LWPLAFGGPYIVIGSLSAPFKKDQLLPSHSSSMILMDLPSAYWYKEILFSARYSVNPALPQP